MQKRSIIFFKIMLLFGLVLTPIAAADVIVSNVDQLNTAIENANASSNADRTILLANGVYKLNRPFFWIERDGVTIRSQSGDRTMVTLQGQNGMNGGVIEFIFQVSADNITIQDMTLEDVGSHAIIIHGESPYDADGTVISNLIIRDTFEQMVKVTPANSDPERFYSEGGLMENCLCYYTAEIGPQYYIGGIDAHGAKDWIIRNNIFKNIRSPETTNPGSPHYNASPRHAEHAIHFWSWSHNTLTEKNLIINCDRGIGYGLSGSGHNNGIIRNNIIYHANLGTLGTDDMGDAGIILETSHDTQVYNNTIYFEHDYANGIEYRFNSTANALIANNLTNKAIRQRDGATGTLVCNIANNAPANWFASVNPFDPPDIFLHIRDTSVTDVIDKGTNAIPGLPSVFQDFDGDSRPQGSEIDIGADEFSDSAPNQSPEINLKQDTADIPDSGSYDFGNKTVGTFSNTVFTIENTGTADLTLTTPISIAGDAAFSIQNPLAASPVAPGETTAFTVRFSPASEGVKTAEISIANNDSDEAPYDLTLTGEGTSPKGDLNGDSVVNLTDAIIALQVITGYTPSQLRTDYAISGADVNGDNQVGPEELIYILQKEAELR